MGSKEGLKTPPKKKKTSQLQKKKPLPLPRPSVRAVPKARKPIRLKARIVSREGGSAAEAAISYGPLKLSGGALRFSAMDKTYGYGRLGAGFGARFGRVGLRYIGAVAYGALGTSNIFTAHHLGASYKFSLGPAVLRLAAGLSPTASYEPVFIEAQWGAGASVSFLDRFTPYIMVGGRLAPGTPVHARTLEYLIPQHENIITGAQYKFRKTRYGRGTVRAEAEFTPFYKAGLAALSWKGERWKVSLGAGIRRWRDDLFAGKTEPVLKGLFSYSFGFGKRVAAKGEVDVEQSPFMAYSGSPAEGVDYEKTSLTEIVAQKVPGKHDSSTFPVFLYTDTDEIPEDFRDDVFSIRGSLTGFFGKEFLDAVSRGYIDDLAKASKGLSTHEKIIRAAFLADMMKNLTYDPDYDTIGRPRDVYGKGPEDFFRDMQEVIHRTASGKIATGWLNPRTSCNEIHYTATTYLRKSGVKAFTLSTATPGWAWHVISAAVGDDGLYLIDYGDIYKISKFDLGLLLQSYAREKDRVILGSYVYTDTDYLGLYRTPEGKLVGGVIGINHYREIAERGLGIER